MKKQVSIFWFRRDLRLDDNAGLYHLLKERDNVLPLFIFDTEILDKLEDKKDRRVDVIYQVIGILRQTLKEMGSALLVRAGIPLEVFKNLCEAYDVECVYTNRDYEPYALKRDREVAHYLSERNISFHSYKDQVIFEQQEVLKSDGSPYTVFTPYSRKWKEQCTPFYYKPYPNQLYFSRFAKVKDEPIPTLDQLGFCETGIQYSPPLVNREVIRQYAAKRDYPALDGTSRLSVHLRFGTVSVRALTALAIRESEVYLNELIWRDFYMNILFHFPHVADGAFKARYNHIAWRNDPGEFLAWCEGRTGYPIVDAGMRELNATGFMHNRVRMITASFLAKHLLINWQWGEAYFAGKLMDFDLAANNGGWQWAAGSGCDAAPYFRIFNPYEQTRKFDKDFRYIRQWVPEFEEAHYPGPIVEHKFARDRALNVYSKALKEPF